MSSITEDQYKKLKRQAEDARSEADRAEGALTQLMGRLKEEFDCDNIKEARALLAQLKSKSEKAETTFSEALEDYEKKWKETND